jgi:hypothetical protein
MKMMYPSRLLLVITILSLFTLYTSAAPTSFAEVEESWQRGLSEVYFTHFLLFIFLPSSVLSVLPPPICLLQLKHPPYLSLDQTLLYISLTPITSFPQHLLSLSLSITHLLTKTNRMKSTKNQPNTLHHHITIIYIDTITILISLPHPNLSIAMKTKMA